VRFMLDRDGSDGGFSMVETPDGRAALAAPLHRHNREDEYRYVLGSRRMGALPRPTYVEAGQATSSGSPRRVDTPSERRGWPLPDPSRSSRRQASRASCAELVDIGGGRQGGPNE